MNSITRFVFNLICGERRQNTACLCSALCALLLAGCGGGHGQVPVTPTSTSATSSGGNAAGGATLTRQEFAYVVNADDNTVAQFKINTDGTLAPLTPATVGVTPNAVQTLITPNGQFAYVMAQAQDTGTAVVSQFKINTDGTLAPLTPATATLGNLITNNLPAGSSSNIAGVVQHPVHLTMDPQGRFLYAPTASQILRFPVSANGTLGTPSAAATMPSPILAFALDPQGRFACIGSQTPAAGVFLTSFTVSPDGSFTQSAGLPASLNGVVAIVALAIDPTGRLLYASSLTTPDAQGSNGAVLAAFTVKTDGTLTPGKTISLNAAFTSAAGITSADQFNLPLAASVFHPVFNATGQFVYLPTDSPRLLMDSVGADGTLTPLSSGFALAGTATSTATIEPSGAFLYVANQDTSVSQFRVSTDGTLRPLATPSITTGHRPLDIVTTAPAVAVAAKSVRSAFHPFATRTAK